MEIMAWAEGMGTCFVTLTDDERRQVCEILNIPDTMVLVTVLPFGYRRDDFRGRGSPRIPISDMVHMGKFGNPYGG